MSNQSSKPHRPTSAAPCGESQCPRSPFRANLGSCSSLGGLQGTELAAFIDATDSFLYVLARVTHAVRRGELDAETAVREAKTPSRFNWEFDEALAVAGKAPLAAVLAALVLVQIGERRDSVARAVYFAAFDVLMDAMKMTPRVYQRILGEREVAEAYYIAAVNRAEVAWRREASEQTPSQQADSPGPLARFGPDAVPGKWTPALAGRWLVVWSARSLRGGD